MNHPYEGGGFCFCPQADNSDGLLDLCVVGDLPKLFILFALPTAFFGRHYIFPKIDHYTASSVRVKTSAPCGYIQTVKYTSNQTRSVFPVSNRGSVFLYSIKYGLSFL